MLDRPDGVVAELVGQYGLSHGIAEPTLLRGRRGIGHLNFDEPRELHWPPSLLVESLTAV